MSLLMKALEKAAKDREETDAERSRTTSAASTVAPAASPAAALELEPLAAAPAPATTLEPAVAPQQAAPARKSPAPVGLTARDPALAATVVRASHREPRGRVSAYMTDHPLSAFGILVAIFVVGYGSYLFMEINSPGMFARMFAAQPPRPANQPPAAPIVTAQISAGGSTSSSAAPLPIPSAPLRLPGADKEVTPPAAAPLPAVAAPPPAPERPAVRDTIKVTSGSALPVINPLLSEGYTALTAGNLEAAQRAYAQLLRGEPGNVDALLGLAAIAFQQNDRDAATRHYLRALEADPRNAPAQAALISMLGSADPQGAESRLKQLIAREPSGYLYFALGNAFIDQKRWPEAQQAFFQAHHLQPDNPEYAYNLAVALDHIGQPKPALGFYRRAAQLASAKDHVNFSIAAVQDRIGMLEKVAR